MEFGQINYSRNLFIQFHEFFWYGLFLIFWPTVTTEDISRVGIDYEVDGDANDVVTEMIDDQIEKTEVDLEKNTSDDQDANNVDTYVTIGSNEENLELSEQALITNSEMKEKPLEQMVKEITLGKFLKNPLDYLSHFNY